MTNPNRQELLRQLAELSSLWPELRLGQMIVNLASFARGPNVESTWDVEDDELLRAVREHVEHFRSRQASVA